MAKQVTMKDIAQAMGVSIVSVSKALSGKDGVSDELRADIMSKADEMGYLAKEDKKKKIASSSNIAIFIAERFVDDRSFYVTIYQQMIMEFSSRGLIAIVEIIRDEDERSGTLPVSIQTRTVSQAVIVGEMKSVFLDSIRESGTDMVFFDFEKDDFDADTVVGDNLSGGYTMTRYLVNNGYSEIAYVGNIRATTNILDRFMGFLKYLLAHGMKFDRTWVIDDRSDENVDIDITLPKKMPQAFFCNCDKTAYRLIQTLNDAGYKVPEDVSVVGYDDYAPVIPEGVELTTYKVDTDEMIHQCAHIVHQRSLNPSYKRGNALVKGSLVERKSVDTDKHK